MAPPASDVHDLAGYRRVRELGQGGFGWVFEYEHIETKQNFAIKKFKENKTEGISRDSLREISILSEMKHDNIVTLEKVVVEPASKTLCLVFPLASNDLEDIIKSFAAQKRQIPPVMVKSFIWQIIDGVNYLHKNWVMHRDLKPANILVMGDPKERGTLKIADFGLARIFRDPASALHENGRVMTLWYRAPELLLGAKHYTPMVDIWSVGCIFGELLTREALFQGDRKESADLFQKRQIEIVFSKIGKPTIGGPNEVVVEGKPRTTWPEVVYLPYWKEIEGQGFQREPLYHHSLPGIYQTEPFKLLMLMMACNPNLRITAAEALNHDYFRVAPLPKKNALDVNGGLTHYRRKSERTQR
uniref:Protein kinase domain-containing protein n=1 Tax=Paramoeba aestuarina TaxID=180227 RepID=A0A7S4KR56_9EUKA|mmetsp:Transcript_2379/g.3709  ORF Transcript_2379/g.3709 Transcript_2379/m.3709 type:complete len:358 (+) Transcript_2379:66-1139(+)